MALSLAKACLVTVEDLRVGCSCDNSQASSRPELPCDCIDPLKLLISYLCSTVVTALVTLHTNAQAYGSLIRSRMLGLGLLNLSTKIMSLENLHHL